MKKSYRKLMLRELRHSLSRFLAIFAIVALGVGFLAGLLATTPDMRYSVDRYYDNTNTMDIRLVSTMGFSQKDVAAVRDAAGVEQVMPAYSADMLLVTEEGETAVTKMHSIPLNKVDTGEYQNQMTVKEGRMPQKKGECVVEASHYLGTSIPVGSKLTLSPENVEPGEKLSVEEFTVVGIVNSAYYFSVERERSTVGAGSVQLIVYTGEESFSYEAYTDIFVTVSGAKELQAFTQEYDDTVAGAVSTLKELAKLQEEDRYQTIVDEAKQALEKAQKEYEDKKADVQKELDDAWNQLEEAKSEIADGRQKLEDGTAQLGQKLAQLEKQEREANTAFDTKRLELVQGKQQLAEQKGLLETAAAQLAAMAPEIEKLRPYAEADPAIAAKIEAYDAQAAQTAAGLETVAQKEKELDAGEAQLAQAELEAAEQFNNGKAQIKQAQEELEQKSAELSSAQKELDEGVTSYHSSKAEAEAQLADGQKKLDDAQKEIDDIAMPQWYVLDRHSNLGYESFDSNAQKVEAIAQVFPIFFFLVAALVALTTMTRMVEEERIEIGTLKALGYSNGKIAFKYLSYAAAACIAGCIFGLLVGFQLFPTVIWNAYRMMYTLPPLVIQFNVKYALLSSVAAIFCTLLATFSACRVSLAEKPARLMLPRAPKAGKRVFVEYIKPLWKRMKFTHKVTARNLIRYKKRFFMTVIGVAGCTALLLTGFGLHDSIGDIIAKQFNEIFKYNLTVGLKEPVEQVEELDISSLLGDKSQVDGVMLFHQENVTATNAGQPDGSDGISVTVTVPQNTEGLPDFVTLRDRKSKQPIVFDDNSVVLAEKLAEQLGVAVGGSIMLEDADGNLVTLVVTGITENYLTSYVYLSPHMYLSVYGEQPEYNLVLGRVADAGEAKRDEISTALLKSDQVAAVSFTDSLKESFTDMLSKINFIVVVLIISAAALAFVVLYNLTNINITERQKEIATIKVLGFYDREVSAYVYRETAILSLIGTAVGLVFGIFLHAFVVKTAEVDAVMFGRDIYFMSYVYATALTLSFSALVNLFMHRKLKNIDMVESMKSNE